MKAREFNVDKRNNFSEWYNTIIYAADLVDGRYNVQGFVVHKPWAMKLIRRLYQLFETELEADGHEPVQFPTVIPEENFLKESRHVEGFTPNVFWVTRGGNEELARPLALRPTSETAFYQMYSLWIRSQADLPLRLYQSCTVFRYEHETLPFMRGREFMWIEAHDAFATKEEAEGQVAADVATGRKILTDTLGIPITVFKRPHWDTFPGADATYAYDVVMPDGKVNQVGSTHMLGQNFARAFDIRFNAGEGKEEQFVWQTCYGPGIWRMVAAIAGVHGDGKGLVIPPEVAPVQVVIVPIVPQSAAKGEEAGKAKVPAVKSMQEDILKAANAVKTALEKAGLRVELDDSSKTPGYKYNYWEMKGVPVRAEIGGREATAGKVTLARRDNREKTQVEAKQVVDEVEKLFIQITQALKTKAAAELKERNSSAESVEQVKKLLDEKGGFVRVEFCSTDAEGTDCGKLVQEKTAGGKVRGTLYGKEEKPEGKCIACGRPAGAVAYVARQY